MPSTAQNFRKCPPPLKWTGGKNYLADRIIGLMPDHRHYIECFFGGGGVLFAKDPEGVSEVINDRFEWLLHFYQAVATPTMFEEFHRRVSALPFSKPIFLKALEAGPSRDNIVASAVRFFIVCRQSRAGNMKQFATLSRRRTRRGRNEQVSSWQTAIEGLPEVHARLQRCVLLNEDAVDVIQSQDGEDSCIYADPPYVLASRATKDHYAHEMTDRDHERLLDTIKQAKSKVLISGYPNQLYDRHLSGWNRTDFDIANHVSGDATKRRMTECVWMNY